MTDETTDDAPREKSRAMRLLPGAGALFGIVLYLNLRGGHVMTLVDWGILALSGGFLAFAVARVIRERKANR